MQVIVKLSGGLGNQLFQYAAARRLALLRQCPLLIDAHWYRDIPTGSTPRQVLISQLRIVAALEASGDPAALAPRPAGRWQRLFGPVRIIKEREPFRFDERLARPPLIGKNRTICLDGYWQSFRYVDPIRDELLAEIRPRRALDPHYQPVAEQIAAATEPVMLHVRRGDYVHSASASAAHGALPLRYYERALRRLRAEVNAPTVFVFSDDIPWARLNLKTDCDTSFVEGAPGEHSVIDELVLMQRCKHQIIANSSLSWWAAWLNPHPGKKVYAPGRWQAGRAIDLGDLIPREWALLDAD